MLFYRAAAVVAPDPHLCSRDHPPSPGPRSAYLRKGDPFAEIAAGFGVSTATAWRDVNETVALLAAAGRVLPGRTRPAPLGSDR